MRTVLWLMLSVCCTAQETAPVDWVRAHAIPLHSVTAGSGFADLEALRPLVGDAHIVALGEATHGSREFFQMKHRLLEFLATEMGFNIFAIEDSMPEAYRLNGYVLNGVGDPKELVKGLTAWPWKTEEVLDMVRWMREYNASGKGPLQFGGFDMQAPQLPSRIVQEFLGTADPEYAPIADYIHQTAVRQVYARGYAQTYTVLPQGSRLRLNAHVRAANVTRGAAGLIAYVVDRDNNLLASDSPMYRKLEATHDWQNYDIELELPPGAAGVQWGPYHSGDGTAWFDSLEAEVDGYAVRTYGDLRFESSTPVGFYTGTDGYSVQIDRDVSWNGRQSLRIQSMLPPNAAVVSAAKDVVEYMQSSRARYLEAGFTPGEIDWAIQNARLIAQVADMARDVSVRDGYMTRNVQWILEQNPGAKIVLWAHNLHVTKEWDMFPQSMGGQLRQMYGDDFRTIGFAFSQGSFQAAGTKGIQEFTVEPAPPDTLDGILASAEIPCFALPLAAAPEWLAGPLLTRVIGAGFGALYKPFYPVLLPKAFDVLLFVSNTTRARPLD